MYMKYTLTSYLGAAFMYMKFTLTSYLGAALMYIKYTLTSYLGAALMYIKCTLTSYLGEALMYMKFTLTSYLGAALKTSLWRGVGHEKTSHLGRVPREERSRIKSLGAIPDCPVAGTTLESSVLHNLYLLQPLFCGAMSDCPVGGTVKAWIFCPSGY